MSISLVIIILTVYPNGLYSTTVETIKQFKTLSDCKIVKDRVIKNHKDSKESKLISIACEYKGNI